MLIERKPLVFGRKKMLLWNMVILGRVVLWEQNLSLQGLRESRIAELQIYKECCFSPHIHSLCQSSPRQTPPPPALHLPTIHLHAM